MTDTQAIQVLEIRPFLGPIRVNRKDQRVIPEEWFEEERAALATEYHKRRDMIAGGFSMKWYGEERLGPKHWDDVVPLMSYIRKALHTLKQGASVASFPFADQPVEITLDKNGPRQQLRVSVSILFQQHKESQTLFLCDGDDFVLKLGDAVDRLEQFLASL